MEEIALYKDYMVNFKKKKQKEKPNEKAQKSKKHGGTLEGGSYAGREKKAIHGKHSQPRKLFYGIRRRAGKPEYVKRVSEDSEEYSSTTRFIESSLGIKSYAELAPHLAKGVERVMAAILTCKPEELRITSEFICKLHRDTFTELFPSWAGRYRDRNIMVGRHKPPPYFEVPSLMQQYCDDLEFRLASAGSKPPVTDIFLEVLAFAEGRFLTVHPFLDFNGRTVRMLLFALLYRIDLPPVQLISEGKDKTGKAEYLHALSEADKFKLKPLIEI